MAQVPGSIQVEIPSWISRGGRFANSFDWLVSQYGGRSPDRLSTVQMRNIRDGQIVPLACNATLKHQISGLNWSLARDEEGNEPIDRKDKKGQHYYNLLDNWMDDEGNVIGFASGVDLMTDDILTARQGGCNEVIRDGSGVAQYVLHVDAATIRFTHDNEHPVFQVSPWGEMTEAWEADRFMQVRWHPNPKIGASLSSRSPVQLAYSAIAILAGTDTYNWKIVAEPIPAGILNLGPGFNDARAKQWKASWDASMQGIDPEPLAIIYGTPSLDYKAFRPPPRDMAFESSDHWYASLVAACFEMSILDISILTKVATKAAAEEQAEATKRQGLRQLMRKIREAIENHLLEEGIYFIWEDIDPTDEKVESEIASRNTDRVVKLVGAKMLTEEQGIEVLKGWKHLPDNVKYDEAAFEERRQQMAEQMKAKEGQGGEEEEQEEEGGEEEKGEEEKGEEKVGKSVEKFIAKMKRRGWELSENQDPSLALNSVAKDGNQYLCELGPDSKSYIFKKQDLEKLVKRQAKDDDLGPALEDDDPFWEIDEAYQEELAARVEAGVKKSVEKGGPGSGHWGHAGRQGKRGGSVSGATAMSIRTGRTARQRQQEAKKRGAARAQKTALGQTTQAFGNDPNKRYEFRSKVVSLDDMIASNTDGGAINPDYDPTLQPRARDRTASQLQIDNVAKNMTPEALLWDFHQLDKGAPIVGDDMMVESGNGRTLALRRAREMYPEKWKEYQKAMRDNLEQHGIDPDDVKGIKDPVLVRERVSKVDDRAEFAREANSPAVLQMSPLEQAKQDRRFITPEAMNRFTVGEGQSIDEALRSSANREFVQGFVGHLPQNERATVMRADGSLNRMGLWRAKAAMFSSVFPGEAGDRMADTFFESVDHTTRNFENALSDVLPKVAQAESLITTGRRRNDLSLAMDIAKAIDMHARLKEMKLPARKYVAQTTMWARELTPLQERLLVAFEDASKSRKAVRGILERYADAVINSPDPNQMAMFGGMELNREQLVNRVLAEAG